MARILIPERLERWREALGAVDRSPGTEWTARLVHHGLRALALIGMAVLVPYLFPQHSLPQFKDLREGERVGREIIAEVPFTVYKSEEQLEAERREAELGITPVFVLDPSVGDSAAARVVELFTQLDSAAAGAGEEESAEADTAAIRRVLERNGVPFSAEQVAFLQDRGRRRLLARTAETTLRSALVSGVVSVVDLTGVEAPRVRVRDPEGERLLASDSLQTVRSFLLAAGSRAPRRLSSAGRDLYQNILVRYVTPSLALDRPATRQAREWARSAVEAAAGYVLGGATIVAAGERLDREDLEKLSAYRAKLAKEGLIGGLAGLWRGLGSWLIGALLLGLLGAVLYCFRPAAYRDARAFFLIFALLLLVLVLASVIGSRGWSPALIPVAFAALLLGALFDGLLALVVVLVLGVLLAAQPPFTGLVVPFTVVSAGAAAALGIQEIHRRSQSWVLIAVITGGYLVAGAALALLGVLSFRDLLGTVAWGSANATLCTAVAIGAGLPTLERLTGRTTDQTLLELADLNQPLLRRLSREAPGTYAHSVNLANLAEAACQAIGANALLARVGVYYHDIGKLLRPQYFIENQPLGLNPHDRLPPHKSAEVIREHVREGLRLADEAGLPSLIRDFIREHHGTQKISFFLEKAKEEDPDADLNPADFCYPGPKPQSKETAVVMLADAVESASRTLSEPTPERIRQLVDRLVEARLEEGQLDQSPLTLRDLGIVRNEFARVLTGLYHHRIDYPMESSARRGAGGSGGARGEEPGDVPAVSPAPRGGPAAG
ncbi:MAG: HD family phosphohydrolase [Gemmatimonadota bacterium]